MPKPDGKYFIFENEDSINANFLETFFFDSSDQINTSKLRPMNLVRFAHLADCQILHM